MALNFDLLQPANIRENFMAGRKEAQDMETGRLQQQEARLKLDDFQRKQAGLDKFLAAAKQRGKDGDPVDVANDYYEWAVSQRNPELITQAMTLAQTAAQRKKFNAMQNPNQLAGAVQPVAPIAGALGSGTFDPYAAAPTNALAPMAAPSVMTPSNALAPRAAAPAAPAKADRVAEIRNRLLKLSEFPDVPQAKAEATMLLDEYKRLTATHVVGGSLMSGSGDIIGTAPKEATPTDIARLIKERDALPQGDPNRAIYDREITDRGATTRMAQQRLAFDLAKFEWEKKNPTKVIQDDGTGLVAVDTRTGIATPVVYGANGIQAAPAAPSVTVDGRSFPGLRTDAPPSLAGTRVPGKGAGAPTEGERKAATLLQRLQGSQNQLTQALLDDPTAAGPEAFAAAVGKLSTTGANLLNSEERQRVEAAQLDILDAALTLGTGAAYTREQLEGYRQSYFPIYGDKPKNIKDKQARLQNVIDAANIAAGKAGKLVPKPPPVTGGSDVRSAADKILGAK
jgi:hypothetical protein